MKLTRNECKVIRAYYGLTQEQVADKIGVSSMTVSNFERGSSDNDLVRDFYLRLRQAMGNLGVIVW